MNDENNNNNPEEQNIAENDDNVEEKSAVEKMGKQVGDKAKDAVKEVANIAMQQVKKVAKEAIKKGFDALVATVGWEVIIAVIAIVLVIVIVAGIVFYVYNLKTTDFERISDILSYSATSYEQTGDNSNNSNGNNANQNNNNYTLGNARKLVQIEDRQIKLDTENFFNMTAQYINSRGGSYGIANDFSDLKAFLEAEVATFYPDLRERALIGTEVPEGELQGCVQFVRKYGNGNSDIMEYMPYEEYAAEVAKMGLNIDETNTYTVSSPDKNTKAGIESVYNNIKDNFTLDANQNLVLVKLNSTEVLVDYNDWANEENQMYKTGQEYSYTYTVSKELVNYQTVLENYSMPFELCLALLLSTENSGFAKEVANLAKNSTIVIDVQDNEVETEYKYVYGHTSDYNLETKIEYHYYKTVTVSASSVAAEQSGGHASGVTGTTTRRTKESGNLDLKGNDIKRNDDYETITVIDYSTTTKLNLTKVDNWIADINILYEYKPEETNEGPTTTSAGENDATHTEVPAYHTDELNFPNASGSDWTDPITRTYYCSEKRYNKTVTFTSNRKTKQYNEITRDVKETPDKFLSLLKVDPNTDKFDLYNFKNNTKMKAYQKSSGQYTLVGTTFISQKDIFFKLLESNTKTKDLKETMAYLMNLYL